MTVHIHYNIHGKTIYLWYYRVVYFNTLANSGIVARTLFHDCKSRAPQSNPTDPQSPFIPPASTETGAYEAGLTVIGEFNTVEGFCRYFNWLKPPSQLERNSNYHLFKDGIKPMWEDEANAKVGFQAIGCFLILVANIYSYDREGSGS